MLVHRGEKKGQIACEKWEKWPGAWRLSTQLCATPWCFQGSPLHPPYLNWAERSCRKLRTWGVSEDRGQGGAEPLPKPPSLV